jgi:hypothetical protein
MLFFLYILLLTHQAVSAFTIPVVENERRCIIKLASSSSPNEIDVSDLGLTMDDFDAPLPSQLLQGVTTTGYESTSRISSVKDDACMWTESPEKMQATLAIPGLRGQPAMCLSTLTASNTLSVTAFGQVVWSCILRGEVKPETAVFVAKEGEDMIPIIEYLVEKSEPDERWGSFILQVGEDSIL